MSYSFVTWLLDLLLFIDYHMFQCVFCNFLQSQCFAVRSSHLLEFTCLLQSHNCVYDITIDSLKSLKKTKFTEAVCDNAKQ